MARVVDDRGDRVVYHDRSPSWAAWLALGLALIALIIAWQAYNRSGKDLEDTATDAFQNATQQTQEAGQDAGQGAQEATDAVEQGVDTDPDGVDDGAQ